MHIDTVYVGGFKIGSYNLLLKVSETGVNSSFIRKIARLWFPEPLSTLKSKKLQTLDMYVCLYVY